MTAPAPSAPPNPRCSQLYSLVPHGSVCYNRAVPVRAMVCKRKAHVHTERDLAMSHDQINRNTRRRLPRVSCFNCCIIACIFLSLALCFSLKTLRPDTKSSVSSPRVIPPGRTALDGQNAHAHTWLRPKKAGASLWLTDQTGRLRARLLTTGSGPLLSLARRSDNPRVPLSVLRSSPGILPCDQNGKVIRCAR